MNLYDQIKESHLRVSQILLRKLQSSQTEDKSSQINKLELRNLVNGKKLTEYITAKVYKMHKRRTMREETR